ncbi:MAG: MarR family transcriptional regulator [Gammaproteobacteria bacterium]|nr:MAG: MarR family transcriptional regulator [Gammaproteobacteria bacterium]
MARRDEEFSAGDTALKSLLAYRLNTLMRLYSRQLARYLSSSHKISPAEWFILAHLGEYSPRTLRWLAQATLLDKGQLSRAAAVLVEKRYIDKAPDPNDARSALFSITPLGETVRASVMQARRDLNVRLAELMTPEERVALDRALEKMTAFFMADDPAGHGGND